MKIFIDQCKSWFQSQNHTTKAFIWIALILIIGVVFRWNTIILEVTRGFQYFKK